MLIFLTTPVYILFRKAAHQGSADAQSYLKSLLNHLHRKYKALKKSGKGDYSKIVIPYV